MFAYRLIPARRAERSLFCDGEQLVSTDGLRALRIDREDLARRRSREIGTTELAIRLHTQEEHFRMQPRLGKRALVSREPREGRLGVAPSCP